MDAGPESECRLSMSEFERMLHEGLRSNPQLPPNRADAEPKVTFRMKVDDLFRVGEGTIFAGTLETRAKVISKALCVLQIDGERTAELLIEGEVLAGTQRRDLWTTSAIALTREALRDHEVWLISA